jgi:hypothetical protein|nr:MAG TPA: hypothetical protein [Caudoviricetes sp.]
MAKKILKHKQPSAITSALEYKKSVNDADLKSNFKISLQYLDTTQKYGSAFPDWQKCGLLSSMLDTLKGYCCKPLLEQVDGDKFSIYGNFPPAEKTKFEYPQNVPEDANWARIHITGSAVVAGHIVGDTFYIVFLDKTHKFWMTKKQRGEK